MTSYDICLNFVSIIQTDFHIACYRKLAESDSEARPYPDVCKKRLQTNGEEQGKWVKYWLSIEEKPGWEKFEFSSLMNPHATLWVLNKVLLPEIGKFIESRGAYIVDSPNGLFKWLDIKLKQYPEGYRGVRIEFEWLSEKRQFGLLVNYKFYENIVNRDSRDVRKIQELSYSYTPDGKSNVNFSVDTYNWEHAFLQKFLCAYQHTPCNVISEKIGFNSEFSHIPSFSLARRAYEFGGGKVALSQYSGLMKYGPFAAPDESPRFVFVFREQDRVVARDLYKCLHGIRYEKRFPGMEKAFGVCFSGKAISFCVLDDFSKASFEKAARQVKELGGNNVCVVLVDDDPVTYYTQKSVFLSHGIATQNVRLNSILRRNNFEWFVAGIALQLFCKARGWPWKVCSNRGDTLIIGVSQVWDRPDAEQKRYISYSITTDASGIFKDIQTLAESEDEQDYVVKLAGVLKEKLIKVANDPVQNVRRIVLHCSFRLPLRAMENIRLAVADVTHLAKQLQIVILRINTDHPYSGYDLAQASLVPKECSFVALGKARYILWCDGTKPGQSVSKRPCSPIYVSFDQSYPQVNETDRVGILEDISNLAGANWRGFNAATRPVSVFYCRIVGEFIKEFTKLGLPVPSIKEFMPWFL